MEYAVTEDLPGGLYRLASIEPEVVSAENCTGGVTVTNEFTGMTVTVRKEWIDADLVNLPDSVTFTLFRKAGESFTVDLLTCPNCGGKSMQSIQRLLLSAVIAVLP